MANSDIYSVTWSTEMEGVIMTNILYYEQQKEPDNGFRGSEHLLRAFLNKGAGTAFFLLGFMGDKAEITCARTRKIIDVSQTGMDEAIDFADDLEGFKDETMPAHTTIPFRLSDQRPTANARKVVSRTLYVGGIAEEITNGPYFNVIVNFELDLRIDEFLHPDPDPGSDNVWDMVNVKGQDYRKVTAVDPPLFVSDRASRKQRLCSI